MSIRRLLLPASAVSLLWILLVSLSITTGQPPSVVINGTVVPPLPSLDASAVADGERLYAQYCAACHGANLEGADLWKVQLADGSIPAPPHDSNGHTWHHADALLLTIIRKGGGDEATSRMPGFGDQLSDDKIMAILSFFKSRWGAEQRDYQWLVTSTAGKQ
jgi:mono/diheme cytochrome c family protein